jgi:MraZ protein
VVFTGTYEHSIDAKNRLAIPSKVRAQIQRSQGLGEGDSFSLYVTLAEGGALSLYTEPAFEKRAAELDQSELDADDLLDYERLLFSMAEQVEVDRQGRVRLPDQLLRRTDLGQDVVLLGVKDHLEVRDRPSWLAHVEQVLASRPGLLMDPRKAMRKRRATDESGD